MLRVQGGSGRRSTYHDSSDALRDESPMHCAHPGLP